MQTATLAVFTALSAVALVWLFVADCQRRGTAIRNRQRYSTPFEHEAASCLFAALLFIGVLAIAYP